MRTPSIAAGISAANELSAHSSHSRTRKCAHVCTFMCPHRIIARSSIGRRRDRALPALLGRACLPFSIPGSPAIPPHHTDPCIEEDMAAQAEEIGETRWILVR